MLVLFDLDDTLIDDRGAASRAAEEIRPEVNACATPDQFCRDWLRASKVHYERYLRGEVTLVEQRRLRMRAVARHAISDEVADKWGSDYLEKYEKQWKLFDDVLPCLDCLAGFPLGIISNGITNQQIRKLQRFDLTGRFNLILTSQQMGYTKPDARIFHYACDQAEVTYTEAVYIGDNYLSDAVGAANAGLTGIWLNRTGKKVSKASNIISVDTLADVYKIVSGLLPQKSVRALL